jgi:hypothetical protein
MNEQEKQALLNRLFDLEARCNDQQTRIEELEKLVETHTDEIRLLNKYSVTSYTEDD